MTKGAELQPGAILPGCIWTPTVHRRPRRHSTRVAAIIWHWTGMNRDLGALRWLQANPDKVSCHFLVYTTGVIHQMALLTDRTNHAGKAIAGLGNEHTVGIELVSPGWKRPGIEWEHGWEVVGAKTYARYPEAQLAAAMRLGGTILHRLGLDPSAQLGHRDVALPAGRKLDPGPLFNMANVRFLTAAWKQTAADEAAAAKAAAKEEA